MRKIITGVAFICLFASNSFAFGDGINVSGLQVNPSVTIFSQFDDNITLAGTGAKSSGKTIVNPAIDIVNSSKIHQFKVHYDFERGDFANSKNDSYSDHHVSGAMRNEVTSKATVETTASYTKSHDQRGATFTGITTGFNTPDLWREIAATATISYGGKNATGRIEFNGGFSAKRYDNHRTRTAARDLNTTNTGATFYYQIAPQTSLLFEGDYTDIDYLLATSLLDSRQLTLNTGLTWEATAKTAGTVKVGWLRKTFKRGAQSGGGFLNLDAQISWVPLSYSTWTFVARRTATESDSNGAFGSYSKTNKVLLGWRHAWNNRFEHTANIGYTHTRNVGSVRKDDEIAAAVGMNYELAPWLAVGVSYNYALRTSNVVNVSYHRNLYSVNLTGTL